MGFKLILKRSVPPMQMGHVPLTEKKARLLFSIASMELDCFARNAGFEKLGSVNYVFKSRNL